MRDCKSQRIGLLMHNKASRTSSSKTATRATDIVNAQILFARPREASASAEASRCPAWAYVGSANLSESAWGKLVKDKTTKRPKLTCRNWECGVLIPIQKTDVQTEAASPTSVCSMEVFRPQVPVPMQYPGEAYGTRKPWYFTEQ